MALPTKTALQCCTMSSPATDTMSKSPKKRVRFNDTPEYAPPKEQGELAGQSSPKRLKVDPMEALEGQGTVGTTGCRQLQAKTLAPRCRPLAGLGRFAA